MTDPENEPNHETIDATLRAGLAAGGCEGKRAVSDAVRHAGRAFKREIDTIAQDAAWGRGSVVEIAERAREALERWSVTLWAAEDGRAERLDLYTAALLGLPWRRVPAAVALIAAGTDARGNVATLGSSLSCLERGDNR